MKVQSSSKELKRCAKALLMAEMPDTVTGHIIIADGGYRTV
jgi:hypothetical protein